MLATKRKSKRYTICNPKDEKGRKKLKVRMGKNKHTFALKKLPRH